MKRTLIAAALALLTTTTAHAAPEITFKQVSQQLPKAMLGEWCQMDGWLSRTRCRNSDGWIVIKPKGFEAHETSCKLKSVVLASRWNNYKHQRRDEYRATFACTGEDGSPTDPLYYVFADDPGGVAMEATDAKFNPLPRE